jgi:hypothetical protein
MAIRFMYLDMPSGQLRRREWVARFVCTAPAICLYVCLALDRCWRHEVACMDRNTWKRCCKTETDKSVRNCTRNGGVLAFIYCTNTITHIHTHFTRTLTYVHDIDTQIHTPHPTINRDLSNNTNFP